MEEPKEMSSNEQRQSSTTKSGRKPAREPKVLFRDLVATFPCLWDPSDHNFKDPAERGRCYEQLLAKYNSISTIPFTMEELEQRLNIVGRQLRHHTATVQEVSCKKAIQSSPGQLVNYKIHQSGRTQRRAKDQFLRLLASFPCLWNHKDIDFHNSVVRSCCREQLLAKYNSEATVPLNMEKLRIKLKTAGKRLRDDVAKHTRLAGHKPRKRVRFRDLVAEFPCLWDPKDPGFTDSPLRDLCHEQLLAKYNNISCVAYSLEALRDRVVVEGKELRRRAKVSAGPSVSTELDPKVRFRDLVAEFPCLWDPRDVGFTDRPLRDLCHELLLSKYNSMSSVTLSMEELRKWLMIEGRELRQEAKMQEQHDSAGPSVGTDVTGSSADVLETGHSSGNPQTVDLSVDSDSDTLAASRTEYSGVTQETSSSVARVTIHLPGLSRKINSSNIALRKSGSRVVKETINLSSDIQDNNAPGVSQGTISSSGIARVTINLSRPREMNPSTFVQKIVNSLVTQRTTSLSNITPATIDLTDSQETTKTSGVTRVTVNLSKNTAKDTTDLSSVARKTENSSGIASETGNSNARDFNFPWDTINSSRVPCQTTNSLDVDQESTNSSVARDGALSSRAMLESLLNTDDSEMSSGSVEFVDDDSQDDVSSDDNDANDYDDAAADDDEDDTIPGDSVPEDTVAFNGCYFCGETKEDCVDATNKSYLTNDKLTLKLNDLSVDLDFNNKTIPKTICRTCDTKLQEIFNFIKVVKDGQEKLSKIIDDVKRNNKNPTWESNDYDDDDKIDRKDIIFESLSVTDTQFINTNVENKRKNYDAEAASKRMKYEDSDDNCSSLRSSDDNDKSNDNETDCRTEIDALSVTDAETTKEPVPEKITDATLGNKEYEDTRIANIKKEIEEEITETDALSVSDIDTTKESLPVKITDATLENKDYEDTQITNIKKEIEEKNTDDETEKEAEINADTRLIKVKQEIEEFSEMDDMSETVISQMASSAETLVNEPKGSSELGNENAGIREIINALSEETVDEMTKSDLIILVQLVVTETLKNTGISHTLLNPSESVDEMTKKDLILIVESIVSNTFIKINNITVVSEMLVNEISNEKINEMTKSDLILLVESTVDKMLKIKKEMIDISEMLVSELSNEKVDELTKSELVLLVESVVGQMIKLN